MLETLTSQTELSWSAFYQTLRIPEKPQAIRDTDEALRAATTARAHATSRQGGSYRSRSSGRRRRSPRPPSTPWARS
jgi:hypothetical protein